MFRFSWCQTELSIIQTTDSTNRIVHEDISVDHMRTCLNHLLDISQWQNCTKTKIGTIE
jgi:type III secretory pathway component EscV